MSDVTQARLGVVEHAQEDGRVLVDGAHGGSASGFFAVDRRVWRRVIELGINAAVSFLILARGSGGDNATTSWSTDAVERYTGISRHRAKAAIALLEEHGILKLLRGGTKPSRKILQAHEIPFCDGHRATLSEAETAFLARLPLDVLSTFPAEDVELLVTLEEADDLDDEQRQTLRRLQEYNLYNLGIEDLDLAEALVRKGYAKWGDWLGEGRRLEASPLRAEDDRDWIWLPNTIVDGAADEISPIETIRQARDLRLLRVFVEFYHAHSLIRHGGFDPTVFCEYSDRVKLGEFGQYVLWCFHCHGGVRIHRFAKPFEVIAPDWFRTPLLDDTYHGYGWGTWDSVMELERLGLIEAVPCVYEGEDIEAELLFPVPQDSMTGIVTEAELGLGMAAREAAIGMLSQLGTDISDQWIAVPVLRHIREPEVRGVYRLRYRPHTQATSQWYGRSAEWEKLKETYEILAQSEKAIAA